MRHDPLCNPEEGCVETCEVGSDRYTDPLRPRGCYIGVDMGVPGSDRLALTMSAPKRLLDQLRSQVEQEHRAVELWLGDLLDRSLPVLIDPRAAMRALDRVMMPPPRFEELAPWKDVTAGDETVWPPLGGSPVPAR